MLLEIIFQVLDAIFGTEKYSVLLPIVLQMMATQSDEQGNVTSVSEIKKGKLMADKAGEGSVLNQLEFGRRTF